MPYHFIDYLRIFQLLFLVCGSVVFEDKGVMKLLVSITDHFLYSSSKMNQDLGEFYFSSNYLRSQAIWFVVVVCNMFFIEISKGTTASWNRTGSFLSAASGQA